MKKKLWLVFDSLAQAPELGAMMFNSKKKAEEFLRDIYHEEEYYLIRTQTGQFTGPFLYELKK